MKQYFYFSKSQKTGILILLFFIVLFIIINQLLPYIYKNTGNFSVENFPLTKETSDKSTTPEITLFHFDPNTLDSTGFAALGLQTNTTKNILKYRSKGGRFKTPQDFEKIYGLPNQQFETLKPYITIKNKPVQHSIELNTCDTTDLKKLKGIGSVFAIRIVKYRNLLGGFHNPEQLKEVYGLNNNKYDAIKKYVYVNQAHIQKIPLNKVSLKQLSAHPYVDYNTAKNIVELRKKKTGKLVVEDIENEQVIPNKIFIKIQPYLSFE